MKNVINKSTKNMLIFAAITLMIILQLFFESTISAYIQFALILLVIILLFPEMLRIIKELKNPKKGKLPEWFVMVESERGRVIVLFMALFFIIIGLINLKLRFLGRSSGFFLPTPTQIGFSIFMIILGSAFLFIASLKFSKSLRTYVNKNYFVISKLILIVFALLIITLVAILIISANL